MCVNNLKCATTGMYILMIFCCGFISSKELTELTAYQSLTYATFNASQAVDGKFIQEEKYCAHGNDSSGGPNWLVVDLKDVYHISHVILTPRKGNEKTNNETELRMGYLYIGITNYFNETTNQPVVRYTYPLCIQSPNKANALENMTLNCRPNTPPGRYVIVQQPITGPGYLTVCEIQIFGEKAFESNETCSTGYYGEMCDKLCNCFKNIQCDKSSGTCVSGCEEGWNGSRCDERNVDNSTLFVGILDKPQTDSTIFDKLNINCIERCAGYGFSFAADFSISSCFCTNKTNLNFISTSEKIDLYSVCANGTYGYNCTLKCNCLSKSRCTLMEGSCEDGCHPGWSGESCNKRNCSDNNGDCSENEKCNNSTDPESCECNEFTYRINSWTSCLACSNGKYGVSCASECKCLNNSRCTFKEGFCPDGCHPGWSGEKCDSRNCSINNGDCSEDKKCISYSNGTSFCEDSDTNFRGISIGLIVGITLGLVIVLVGLLIIYKYYKTLQKYCKRLPYLPTKEESETRATTNTLTEEYEAIEVFRQVKLEEMPEYFKSNIQTISKEFEMLNAELAGKTYGKQEKLRQRNRFKNVLPYESNRVILQDGSNKIYSDYINASYIKDVISDTLIATQGPTKESVDDFWKMIWQEEVGIVVMLCNVLENDKVKCEQYWPLIQTMTVHNFSISNKCSSSWPGYSVTAISISKEEDETRDLIHLHFKGWPDHSVPNDLEMFLSFCRHYRRLYDEKPCNVLVHCSAGIGRTGCFLAITDLLRRGYQGEDLSVPECVSNLRKSRMRMVEKQAQYVFLYKCLVREVELGATTFTFEEFELFYNSSGRPGKERTQLENQHKALVSVSSATDNSLVIHNYQTTNQIGGHSNFRLLIENEMINIWSKIPKNCHQVIVFIQNEDNNFLPLPNQPFQNKNVTVKLLSMKNINEVLYLKISLESSFQTCVYENTGNSDQIYENTLSSIDSEHLIAVSVIKLPSDNMNVLTFMEVFQCLTTDELTHIFVKTGVGLGQFFVAGCNIINHIVKRGEVAIYQNILETQLNGLNYHPSWQAFEKLHELANSFVSTHQDIN